MEFLLLGRFLAQHDGQRVELGRRRERCLLAVLLLEPNTVVPLPRLADLLWEGDPPPTARRLIHTHVSRLRRRIDPDGTGGMGVALETRDGGYALRIDPQCVDVHRFLVLERQARDAEPAGRVPQLRRALALWRGPLLADVFSPGLRERVGAQLIELRRLAIERLADAEVASGRHREVRSRTRRGAGACTTWSACT